MAVALPRQAPEWVFAPRDAASADGRPIDVAAENAAAIGRLLARHAERPDGPLVVVPGYTPLDQDDPLALHKVARERLASALRAAEDLGAIGILVSGGNVHPVDTPFNEAWEMRRALRHTFKVADDAVVIEPYARHSTTNLRNAGRFMLAHGLRTAVVVTDFGQGFYFGAQDISTFRGRCERELGYTLGDLEPAPWFTRIRFSPCDQVLTRGPDPLDP